MKVTILATGKTAEVSACYGARLIEQNRAVVAAAEKKKTAGGKEKSGKR